MPRRCASASARPRPSLLALAGIDAEPPQSREHILLVDDARRRRGAQGEDLDLPALIQQVQTPPFEQVGVVDLESFFPAKERFALAMQLNELLAAPGFERGSRASRSTSARSCCTPQGKPRVAVFSIAHLGDAERMFFVSLLLNQMVGVDARADRARRACARSLYMDEIFGYFPPVANPPSKAPLLTLLKQARAFGLGVVLATQNPVDLDYKGLANTGTWFLGRLQTERDKARVLDGLEGAAAADRSTAPTVDRLLSALGKRVFLLHNVHEDAPVVFQTRWTLSYLRGPLTRDQIKTLTADAAARPARRPLPAGPQRPRARASGGGARRADPAAGASRSVRRASSSSSCRRRSACRGSTYHARRPRQRPSVASPTRRTASTRRGTCSTRSRFRTARCRSIGPPRHASTSRPATSRGRRPGPAQQEAAALGASQREELPDMGEGVRPAGSRRAETLDAVPPSGFEAHVASRARASATSGSASRRRNRASRATRRSKPCGSKYAAKQAQLAEQLRRAEASVAREQQQASQAKLQTAVSMGATLLGALLGRKAISVGTLGRATTAARGVGRSMKESEDIKRAGRQRRGRARADRGPRCRDPGRDAAHRRAIRGDAPLERVSLTPKRGQITVQFVALGWLPGDGGARST